MTSHSTPLDRLTAFVDRVSRSWRAVLVVALVFIVALGLLMAAGAAFSDVSGGNDPFDLQNSISADDVRAQLAAYTDASTGRYLAFAAVDLVFPVVGSLLIASIAAACLRSAAPTVYERALRKNLLLLFFLPALFDWTENVFAIWIVVAGEPASALAISWLIVAKTAKLIALTAAQLTCAVIVLWWVWATLRRRLRENAA